MEEYKSNSDKAREKQRTKKKVEAVIDKPAKIKKKGRIQPFADVFFAEDADNVKDYIFVDIIIPTIKKAISEVVTTATDIFLYGNSDRSKKNGTASRISYSWQKHYERNDNRIRAVSNGNPKNTIAYGDVLFDTRGQAEMVLDAMNDVIERYGVVSISDFYDLARIANDNFTLRRYGWMDISDASVARVRGGYILKLPRAIPLD